MYGIWSDHLSSAHVPRVLRAGTTQNCDVRLEAASLLTLLDDSPTLFPMVRRSPRARPAILRVCNAVPVASEISDEETGSVRVRM
jgi:hypothetical protein